MLGKGRGNSAMEFLMVKVDLSCDRGHHVGTAWKDVAPSPAAGNVHVSQVRWVDSSAGGMITTTCPRCHAEPQWRWTRVLDHLDTMAARGQQSDTMRP